MARNTDWMEDPDNVMLEIEKARTNEIEKRTGKRPGKEEREEVKRLERELEEVEKKIAEHMAKTEDKRRDEAIEADRLRNDMELLEDPETICSFGQMAFDGDGVERDFVQAANWYKIAAEQGHARSQHNLALMYESGQGVPRNTAQAAKWYRMAAEQGHAGSQNNLGALYESGDGVPQDNTIALDLYRQAAKGGDLNAASNMERLESLMKEPAADRKQYEEIVFAFSDLMATHSPLIGDCSFLPYPKNTILYAIKWVMEDCEEKRDTTANHEIQNACDKVLLTLRHLLTRLARDWQEIDPADKGAIEKLRDCESFPQWALPLKQKYIDDERASKEAYEVTFQVMKDRARRKAIRDVLQ